MLTGAMYILLLILEFFKYNGIGFEKIYNNISELSNRKIFAIKIERANNSEKLWLFSDNFIGYIYNNELKKVITNLDYKFDSRFLPFSFFPNYFNSIVYGNIIHIKLFDKTTCTTVDFNKSNGLIDNGATQMMIDRENILWISSNRGLSKVSSLRFQNYFQSNGLLEDEVSSIVEQTPGNFIFGHNSGITFFDGKTFKPIKFNKEPLYERVHRMAKDRNNKIWMACYKNGLGEINLKQKITWHSIKELNVNGVMSVAIDSNNRVLFTDNNSLYEYKNGFFTKN